MIELTIIEESPQLTFRLSAGDKMKFDVINTTIQLTFDIK